MYTMCLKNAISLFHVFHHYLNECIPVWLNIFITKSLNRFEIYFHFHTYCIHEYSHELFLDMLCIYEYIVKKNEY